MDLDDDLLGFIDLIYEAAVNSARWPAALIRLADITKTAQVALASMDCRAQTYDAIAPRTDPVMHARYKNYWAFHNPLWHIAAQQPAGAVYSFDSIMSRKDFTGTPVFNEWFRPADFGLAFVAANLFAHNQVSSLLCVANTTKNDHITTEQMLAFKAALPHVTRAVQIHRELRTHDLDHDTAPERLEHLQRSVMLVDGAARVLFANAAARKLLGSHSGLTVKTGCLHSTDESEAIQGLIASCSHKAFTPQGPGGKFSIQRGPRRSPLRVMVTPLRAKGAVAELPWLGFNLPVAIVTVADSAREKSLH